MDRDPPPSTATSDNAMDTAHHRAFEDLRYIRETMARASAFTAVPGWATLTIGLTALAAATLAARQTDDSAWLLVWLGEAAIAAAIGVGAMFRKARAIRVPLLRGAGARFVFGLCPPFFAGAILTAVLYDRGLVDLLPSTWLLLYGTGITTAGAFSVRMIPLMGVSFVALGALAFLVPAGWGDAMMAAGFGGLNVVFGLLIARMYGG